MPDTPFSLLTRTLRACGRLLAGPVCAFALLVCGLPSTAADERKADDVPAAPEKPAGAAARLGDWHLAHRDNVSCVAYSPDGRALATSGHDNYVRLWDPTTGRQLRALRHGRWVRSIVWSPDSKLLYSCSDNEGIRVWDPATGKERARLHPTLMVSTLALSSDGKTLAWTQSEQTVVVHDLAAGRELFRFQAVDRAYRLAFSPDGKVLAVGGEVRKVRRWQVATGKELPAYEGLPGNTYPVAFSPDGKWLACGCTYPAGTIHLWDTAAGKEVRSWKASAHAIYSLAFSPDSKMLLSGQGSSDRALSLWETATGRELRTFSPSPGGLVDAVTFTPDGKRAASGGCWERGVYLWDVATGKEVSPFTRHHGEVHAVAFSPDGKLLATGSADRSIALWETSTGKAAGRLTGQEPVAAVAFSPDGKWIASASQNERFVRLWLRATQKVTRELKGKHQAFACLAFSPDGQLLATGEAVNRDHLPGGAAAPDGVVLLWRVSTGEEVRQLQGKAGRVNALAFSPDGKVLATTGLDDRAIHLWDPQTGTERGRLARDTDPAAPPAMFEGTRALAFSPDGRTLACISFYEYKSNMVPKLPARENEVRMVCLWEMATGKVRHQIRLTRNSVLSAAFVGNRYLILGERGGGLRVCDLEQGTITLGPRGHQDATCALALSPDGRLFASGSHDTTALLWHAGRLAAGRPRARTRPGRRELEALAGQLLSADPGEAYRAMWVLAAAEGAEAVLGDRLRPVPAMDAARIEALVRDLDSDAFEKREEASATLQLLAETAAPALREAVRKRGSLEVVRRAEVLLARLESGQAWLPTARILEVLENAATPEAKRILTALAKGAPTARLTMEARAALRRLDR